MANGRPFPPLFNFKHELAGASPELVHRFIPYHIRRQHGLNLRMLGVRMAPFCSFIFP
ncbi:Os01g0229900 [Oryza sativa Japonica Group]|uniref:Os01g0229900 protein n=1 Tax=Oryza sativa subsp. japonica TaxID=39947 RepID=C7IWF0_ORYSJ|nr:Os01g0229900 [Oryza sativa Japonica Group]|eukprot:NP_001172242.1 Os01g0229900 [Oryza sativa Japonica Group]